MNAPAADSFRIEPLSDRTWPALAGLFEEGGDPRWCFCAYFRVRSSAFSRSAVAEHRDVLHRLLERPLTPGLVALEPDGRAVGWVSLGPREDFERLRRSRVLAPLDERPVWSIVCFVVARRARRHGLMGRLLEAAIAFAREHDAPALEAYPVDASQGRPSAATLYSGSLATFLRAGFVVAREVVSPQSTVARTIVRLDLDARKARRPTTVDTPVDARLDSASGAARADRPAQEEELSE